MASPDIWSSEFKVKMSNATEIFVLVASACVIIITLFIATLAVFAIRAIIKIRSITQLLQAEAEYLIAKRRRLERGIFFLRRWAEIFLSRAIDGKRSANKED